MKKLNFILIFLIGFIAYYVIDAITFSHLQKEITALTKSKAIGHILTYTITLIPLFATVAILHRNFKNIFEKLGLSGNLFVGFLFAFVVTLPSLIAYGLKFSINFKLSFDTIIINTISSAFFEEIIYRAFLIGQLYRFTRLGFLSSILIGSTLFGLVHLYQSNNTNELIGIFLITFLGSILFFWIYAEWKFNLWTAIFLHCLMNLYWLVFDIDNNALGGTYANIFRFGTVFLAIYGTILYKKKAKIPFEINKKTWWLKSQNNS
ncbi:MAG: type II CAAX endopeptidase family protein [Cyclobacteriaceae bacterium]|nr:type II CAAX endopeptidase family protein [Cyclobacteriaceae bacterium]